MKRTRYPMGRRGVLGTIGLALVGSGFATSASAWHPETYEAELSGEGHGIDTIARGTAHFELEKDELALRYTLEVVCVCDATMAHVHLGSEGEDGPVVAWLYPEEGEEPETREGWFTGTLGEGTITDEDLVGPLEGESIEALVDAMIEEGAYVNVHTERHPDGEIRGQIVPTEEFERPDEEPVDPDEEHEVTVTVPDQFTLDPIEGATVRLVDVETGDVAAEGTTGEDGTVDLRVPDGEYRIEGDAEGYFADEAERPIEVDGEDKEASIALYPEDPPDEAVHTLRIEATRLDTDTPIRGRIWIEAEGDEVASEETDDGVVEFEVGDGTYGIYAEPEEFVPDTRDPSEVDVDGSDVEVAFEVEPMARTVTFEVTDAETGDPVEDAVVRLTLPPDGDEGVYEYVGITGEDGTAEIRVHVGELSGYVTGDTERGHVDQTVEVEIEPDTDRVEIELHPPDDDDEEPDVDVGDALEVSDMEILGTDPQEEWIDLTNTGDEEIDLSGYRIRDTEGAAVDDRPGTDPYVFEEFRLGGGDTVRIRSSVGEDDDETLYWGQEGENQQIWSEEGDTVRIFDPGGALVFEHSYEAVGSLGALFGLVR